MKTILCFIVLLASVCSSAQNLTVNYIQVKSTATSVFQTGDELEFLCVVHNNGAALADHSTLQLGMKDLFTGTTHAFGKIAVPTIGAQLYSDTLHFFYTIPANFPSFNVLPFASVDCNNEVLETSETDNVSVNTNQPFAFLNVAQDNRTIPYPMLFIHGLNSNSLVWETWLNMLQTSQGWQNGGTFHYCLNGDGNTGVASLSEVQNHTNYASLHRGDFYCLNFDVNPDGTAFGNNVESNQSAIVKQGWALKQVVDDILALTGAEKIILVGHSMGGLCSREFIQNFDPNADKTKRLTTIFTPHGGSNATGFGLEMFVGLNELGEAIRDLRYSYYADYPGVYLFGGVEDNNLVTNTFFDFDNVDVNCNGILMENIVGINQKAIPDASKMDFSCVIGTGSALGGDAIVDDFRANLNNYLPQVAADTFIIVSPDYYGITEVLHTAGPQDPNLFDTFIAALDEAEEPSLAYDVEVNAPFYGRLDPKSLGSPEALNGQLEDKDWYSFSLPTNANLQLRVDNLMTSTVVMELMDENLTTIASSTNNGSSRIALNAAVDAGNYFVSIQGLADLDSYQNPYRCFFQSESDYTGLTDVSEIAFTVFPNPAQEMIYLKGGGTNETTWMLVDAKGMKLGSYATEELQQGLSVGMFPKGMYFLQNSNGHCVKWMK